MNEKSIFAAIAEHERVVAESENRIVERIRKELIIPLCKKHDVKFCAGMGTWFFSIDKERAMRIDRECEKKGIDFGFYGNLNVSLSEADQFRYLFGSEMFDLFLKLHGSENFWLCRVGDVN